MSNPQGRETTASYDDLLLADGAFEVEGCAIDARVSLAGEALTARSTLRLRTERPLTKLRFNLARSLKVKRVTGSPAISRWGQRLNVVSIVFTDVLRPHRRARISFEYHGPLRIRSHHGQLLSFVSREGCALTDWWFPWLRGMRASFRVTLHTPKAWSAVGNGELVSSHEGTASMRHAWVTARPVSNFEVAIGKYRTHQTKAKGTKLVAYTYEHDVKRAADLLQAVRDILEVFQGRFGPLPWREFHIAEIPDLYGGGRARAPMLWLSRQLFTAPVGPGLLGFLAHELSHHWWGGLVEGTGKGWLWLHEGFAGYSELLYTEAHDGRKAYEKAIRSLTRRYRRRMSGKKQEPLLALRMGDPAFYYIAYWKGALILHRLRKGLGDEPFFQTLQSFCRTFAGKLATVEDFQRCAEEAGRCRLESFFKAALLEAGLPRSRLIPAARALDTTSCGG